MTLGSFNFLCSVLLFVFIAYLVVLSVVLISLIIRTDTGHQNSEIYQAMQIGVLQVFGRSDHQIENSRPLMDSGRKNL